MESTRPYRLPPVSTQFNTLGSVSYEWTIIDDSPPSYPKLIQPPPLYRYLHCSFYIQYDASHPPQPSRHSCHSIYHDADTPNIYICSVLRAPSHHILILGDVWNKVGIHEKQLLDHIRSSYVQLIPSYPSYNFLQVTHARWYFIPSSIPSYQWIYTCRYQCVHVHVHVHLRVFLCS